MNPMANHNSPNMTPVYLGLGGNVGDVLSNMAAALQHLNKHDQIDVLDVSDVYKTSPWGITEQDWFLNCCAKVQTTLGPHELLDVCLSVEVKLKRKRIVRWGPRSVDVDILVFGDLHFDVDHLTIPHPRMHERAFVMVPLADIAPGLTVNGTTARELAKDLASKDIIMVETTQDWWNT